MAGVMSACGRGKLHRRQHALESKDQLKRRIDEAAKFTPLDQLCLSP
jgi:5-methyltetrahydropteroyltriglutamate--homocysteine methyltransferase